MPTGFAAKSSLVRDDRSLFLAGANLRFQPGLFDTLDALY